MVIIADFKSLLSLWRIYFDLHLETIERELSRCYELGSFVNLVLVAS